MAVAYGAGLRASEVVALKASDIDAARMLLRVEQGKGQKDRHAMLSPQLLEILRAWWCCGRRRGVLMPGGWLFPGRDRLTPLTARQLGRIVHAASAMAGIEKRISPHTLRHSFATHLLENRTDIRIIQVPLSHAKLETTTRYAQVATKTLQSVTSPHDRLEELTVELPPPAAAPRRRLSVARIFLEHGATWRQANAGHLSRDQLAVMAAIERCRTAALGGHVEECADCGHRRIAYNSCRNRHCPQCQAAAARAWLEARQADLLPIAYFHVVFTLPAEIGRLAYTNKAANYDLLFRIAADTLLTIAADPKHLGAKLGITAVPHS